MDKTSTKTTNAMRIYAFSFILYGLNTFTSSFFTALNKALLLDTIRHEIEHIFQQIKSGKVIPQNNAYNTFAQPMYLYNEDNITKTIANLIYLSERFEIDAMVNGLYGELKEMGGKGYNVEVDFDEERGIFKGTAIPKETRTPTTAISTERDSDS